MNPAYQRALAQLDELMADIRKQAAASCSHRRAGRPHAHPPECAQNTACAPSTAAPLPISTAITNAISTRMNTIKPGIYRHYKGKLYEVSGIARHSETEEALVVLPRALRRLRPVGAPGRSVCRMRGNQRPKPAAL
jgi:hypothetical protein